MRRKTDDDRQPDEAAGSGQRAAGSGGLQTRIWVKSKAFKREEGRGLLFPRGQEQLGKRLGREGRCLLEKRDTEAALIPRKKFAHSSAGDGKMLQVL